MARRRRRIPIRRGWYLVNIKRWPGDRPRAHENRAGAGRSDRTRPRLTEVESRKAKVESSLPALRESRRALLITHHSSLFTRARPGRRIAGLVEAEAVGRIARPPVAAELRAVPVVARALEQAHPERGLVRRPFLKRARQVSAACLDGLGERPGVLGRLGGAGRRVRPDRKSTRLNSSHSQISYA